MRCPPLLLTLSTAGVVLLAACTNTSGYHESIGTGEVSPPPAEMEARSEAQDMAAAKAQVQSAGAGAARMKMTRQAMAIAPAAPMLAMPMPPVEDRENYAKVESNPVKLVSEQPVSTFSIDVDTGSYSNVRRFLNGGSLPPQDAVRVEELVNYFDYDDPLPKDRSQPFSLHTEIAPTPWNAKTRLLRVAIRGWQPTGPRPASNLVFLVDVSGSMEDPNKLPLVKSSLKLLTRQLGAQDRISLVVYAGASGVVLEPTPGNDSATIESALERLRAGGSTNGGEGIRLAYAMAQRAFIPGGNNRVLLATDGDFNVGTTGFEQLIDLVKEKRKGGVALTTLGFGGGNYNDRLMEQLADAGNGNHAYIDTLAEAQKALVDQRDATLTTIARDVKIQLEFNPALVSEYRLIGYENRQLKREDFANDKVDAGEIGAGHRVTALYEIALAGEGGERIEPLRYGARAEAKASGEELGFLRLRYKRPQDGMDAASLLIERPLLRRDVRDSLDGTSDAYRLSASVAAFGQLLRGGQYTGSFGYTQVERLARDARGRDRHGYAGEFLQMVRLAQGLSTGQARVQIGE
ncbi:VWA domain-containing protein [Solimonas sp. SE-A11]|uniref:vWA domain-containing protein n=1 Tax=Solimonas sp. SE-A11 TaxID=3054954 RepID=UPI00259D2802|nr:VWA domain-containing protein [Solimonas sp. SE-A11]MDM4771670.1 VWA domain-containing protein [Solimonas sp. SE-A11]